MLMMPILPRRSWRNKFGMWILIEVKSTLATATLSLARQPRVAFTCLRGDTTSLPSSINLIHHSTFAINEGDYCSMLTCLRSSGSNSFAIIRCLEGSMYCRPGTGRTLTSDALSASNMLWTKEFYRKLKPCKLRFLAVSNEGFHAANKTFYTGSWR